MSNQRLGKLKIVGALALGTIVATTILMFVAIAREANSYLEELRKADRLLEEHLEPLRTFRDDGGVALGCYNSPAPRALPSLGAGASPGAVEKVKAVEKYLMATWNLAKALDASLRLDEQLLNSLSPVPSAVGALPWARNEYTAGLARISSRLAWAKRELADHSCSKQP